MTKRTDERCEFLATILSTAVEGGINYWASVGRYRWGFRDLGLSTGGPLPEDVQPFASVEVEEMDSDDVTPFHVDIDTIAKGLRVIREARAGRPIVAPLMRANIMLADRTNGDEGDIDALDADAILQAGIFGEVVYG